MGEGLVGFHMLNPDASQYQAVGNSCRLYRRKIAHCHSHALAKYRHSRQLSLHEATDVECRSKEKQSVYKMQFELATRTS
jgi:hypothetical protein